MYGAYPRLFELSTAPEKIEVSNNLDDWDWEDALYQVDYLVDPSGSWHVDAENIGWRNMSGEKDFTCNSASDWLREVAGFDCAWSMQIMVHDQDNITAYVYHHDSPTGELREITRIGG